MKLTYHVHELTDLSVIPALMLDRRLPRALSITGRFDEDEGPDPPGLDEGGGGGGGPPRPPMGGGGGGGGASTGKERERDG